MATNHCCLPKQTAKVCGSANYIIPQTSSANGGSEPGLLHLTVGQRWQLTLKKQFYRIFLQSC
jgi:hypothetical protein